LSARGETAAPEAEDGIALSAVGALLAMGGKPAMKLIGFVLWAVVLPKVIPEQDVDDVEFPEPKPPQGAGDAEAAFAAADRKVNPLFGAMATDPLADGVPKVSLLLLELQAFPLPNTKPPSPIDDEYTVDAELLDDSLCFPSQPGLGTVQEAQATNSPSFITMQVSHCQTLSATLKVSPQLFLVLLLELEHGLGVSWLSTPLGFLCSPSASSESSSEKSHSTYHLTKSS